MGKRFLKQISVVCKVCGSWALYSRLLLHVAGHHTALTAATFSPEPSGLTAG